MEACSQFGGERRKNGIHLLPDRYYFMPSTASFGRDQGTAGRANIIYFLKWLHSSSTHKKI